MKLKSTESNRSLATRRKEAGLKRGEGKTEERAEEELGEMRGLKDRAFGADGQDRKQLGNLGNKKKQRKKR